MTAALSVPSSVQEPDRNHGALDLLLRAVRDLADRQARLGRAAAEQARRIFHRAGAGLAEQRLVQREEPLMDRHGFGETAGLPGVMHLGAETRRDIGGD